MKKILLVPLFFAMSILFFMQKYDIKKDINDYLIVDIEFTGNPRMYGKKDPQVKLIDNKTNQEVMKYNNLIDKLFLIKEGNYTLEVFYENNIIIKNIEKQADKNLKYKVLLKQTPKNQYLDKFIKTFALISLIFNIFIFIKFYKESKKRLIIIFAHLLIIHFLSFTNLFSGFQLKIMRTITEISLIYFLMIYFSSYLKKKSEKISSLFILVSAILIIYLLSMTGFAMNDDLLVYFLKYHPLIFKVLFGILIIINIVLNLGLFIIPYGILINNIKNIKNKNLRNIKIHQILYLTLIFVLTILASFVLMAKLSYYPKYDALFLIGMSLLFWILFLDINEEIALKIYKKYRNLNIYILKVLGIFVFIYFYIISNNTYYYIAAPILVIYILGEIIYYFVKTINENKTINSYNKFLNQLKGIENIDEFKYIIEKEILKRNSLKGIKFEIILDHEDEKKYVSIINENEIIENEYLEKKYQNYNFGIRIKSKNNICIALLLIEVENKKYLKELITSLSLLMEDITYPIIYIRTVSLKNSIEKKERAKRENELLKEHLSLIKEFSLLINKKTNDKDIKSYSEIILNSIKELGDKND
ncbi:hypothetical protein [Fusobacterium ulcerans]|uniref:hypothetical protein n=1 Tax=Fusobacterium ulcerans TaxID=861 RepID=UPI001D0AE12F|nr:hypothetical protein [Fusobacterium ulcerans]MCB8563429.1 hypothetical protein [Fusobacterium ulcerans]MCB8647696.1 hypothetical protein [Fusobacterium ulcerans]